MKKISLLAVAALPVIALAAGSTSYSSYINQVPAPPLTAQEAYAGVQLNPPESQNPFEQPPAFAVLNRKLEAESRMAATSGGSGAATGVTDAASAQALQQKMAGMSQADQIALAQQMAAQMNASMQPRPLGPGDRAVTNLLEQRQQSSMLRAESAQRIQADSAAHTLRSDSAHAAIVNEESAALEKTPPQCVTGSDLDAAALKVHQQYAEKHLALVKSELRDGMGLYERQRVLAVDDAGFADQLMPLMKQASSALAAQGYAAARQDALRQVSALAALSWNLRANGATWWLNKLDDRSARRCAGA